MSSFWVYLNDVLKKMPENDQSMTKPETGQNWSGKIFSSGIFFVSVDFKYVFIILIDQGNQKI